MSGPVDHYEAALVQLALAEKLVTDDRLSDSEEALVQSLLGVGHALLAVREQIWRASGPL